MFYWV